LKSIKEKIKFHERVKFICLIIQMLLLIIGTIAYDMHVWTVVLPCIIFFILPILVSDQRLTILNSIKGTDNE